ncbi:unnamed protein product [Symbiodinium natans]|uniref:Uncharacterized protein n=1 Tax=Symbiodinium natans TaxID=878477 RepID=A0A812JUG5_9DINO|nr:unnamed protein product [Symbiodinium natans]
MQALIARAFRPLASLLSGQDGHAELSCLAIGSRGGHSRSPHQDAWTGRELHMLSLDSAAEKRIDKGTFTPTKRETRKGSQRLREKTKSKTQRKEPACQLRSQDFTGAKCRLRPWRGVRPRPGIPPSCTEGSRGLGRIPPGGKNRPPHGRASSLHGANVGGIPRTTAPAARGRALVGIGVRSDKKAGTSGPTEQKPAKEQYEQGAAPKEEEPEILLEPAMAGIFGARQQGPPERPDSAFNVAEATEEERSRPQVRRELLREGSLRSWWNGRTSEA